MTGPAVFRVILRFDVRDGSGAEFERLWQRIAETVSRVPDNLGQWLSRSSEDEVTYYVVTDWRDEASFRTFEHSADHVGNRAALGRFRVGGTMITTHLVASVEPVGSDAR